MTSLVETLTADSRLVLDPPVHLRPSAVSAVVSHEHKLLEDICSKKKYHLKSYLTVFSTAASVPWVVDSALSVSRSLHSLSALPWEFN